jgi:hypothetical protein
MAGRHSISGKNHSLADVIMYLQSSEAELRAEMCWVGLFHVKLTGDRKDDSITVASRNLYIDWQRISLPRSF